MRALVGGIGCHAGVVSPVTEAMTCYRHPDRETGLRCTRCGTPACWECLRPAPVGSHCLKCIREAERTTRHVTLPWQRQTNPAVIAVIAVCVVAYVFQSAGGLRGAFTLRYSAIGAKIAAGELYRLVTAVFLHGGLLHIAFNMLVLWIYGQEVERREGALRFLVVFLGAGILGNVVAYFVIPAFTVSLGASGGVFGLLGYALVRAWRSGGDVRQIAALIGINLLLPLFVPGINVAAHLGGLAAGMLYAAVVPQVARGWRAWTGVVLMLALIGVGVVAVDQSAPGSLRSTPASRAPAASRSSA